MAYMTDNGLGAAPTWQEQCHAKGGVVTVNPANGAPSCRLVASKVGTKTTFRYVDMRSIMEKASDAFTIAGEKIVTAAGKAVAVRDTAKAAVVSTVKKVVAPTPVVSKPVAVVKAAPVSGGTWQDRCRAQGGVPTVDPKSGAPACRLNSKVVNGKQTFTYTDVRTLQEKLSDGATLAVERAQGIVGNAVIARDTAKAAVVSTVSSATARAEKIIADAAKKVAQPITDAVTKPLQQSTTWQARCKAQGGVATVDPKTGAPSCRMPDKKNKGKFVYTDVRNVTEKAQDAATFAQEARLTKQATDALPWQDRCRAQGGVATVDPKTGAPSCRMPDKKAAGKFTYGDVRNITEKMTDAATLVKEGVQKVAGAAVEKRDEVVRAVTGGVVDRTASAPRVSRPVLSPPAAAVPANAPDPAPSDDSPLAKAVRERKAKDRAAGVTPSIAPVPMFPPSQYPGAVTGPVYSPDGTPVADAAPVVQQAGLFGGGSMSTVLLAAGVTAAIYMATSGGKSPRRSAPRRRTATTRKRTRRVARRR